MAFVTMAMAIPALALLTISGGSNNTLPLDGLRTAILINQSLNWSDHRDICRKNYTDLITIYNKKEYQTLSDHYQSNFFFIGLRTGKSAYKWSNGDSFIYDKTIGPQNNNSCIAMTANGSWESVQCCERKPFICYSEYNSSRYHLIREHKNWHESLSYCRKNFIDLVSIRNEEQNYKVLEVKSQHKNNTWIGLRNDRWEWSDNGQRIPDKGLIFHSAYIATTQNGMAAICYKDHIHISNRSMTWEESLAYCRNFSGSFCILTKPEQVAAERLMKRLNITEPVWVGLEQSSLFGTWVWRNSEPVDWSNWEGGQSPQLPLSHHCGALRSTRDDFKWKDMNCRTRLRALCFDWTV